jgi:hypothetical protein
MSVRQNKNYILVFTFPFDRVTVGLVSNAFERRTVMKDYAVYNSKGLGVMTVKARSESDAVKKVLQLLNIKELPKGWFVENLYA